MYHEISRHFPSRAHAVVPAIEDDTRHASCKLEIPFRVARVPAPV
jgi:hypothetical protein